MIKTKYMNKDFIKKINGGYSPSYLYNGYKAKDYIFYPDVINIRNYNKEYYEAVNEYIVKDEENIKYGKLLLLKELTDTHIGDVVEYRYSNEYFNLRYVEIDVDDFNKYKFQKELYSDLIDPCEYENEKRVIVIEEFNTFFCKDNTFSCEGYEGIILDALIKTYKDCLIIFSYKNLRNKDINDEKRFEHYYYMLTDIGFEHTDDGNEIFNFFFYRYTKIHKDI